MKRKKKSVCFPSDQAPAVAKKKFDMEEVGRRRQHRRHEFLQQNSLESCLLI